MNKSEDLTLLYTLLPSSIKNEEVFRKSALILYAGDDSKDHLNDGLFYVRLDELSSEILDHLAAQWHATVWRDSWPVDTKRAVLRSLIQTKSHLGTRSAIRNVLQSLVGNASITEWFEKDPVGIPHTFEIKVTQNFNDGRVSSEVLQDLINAINYAKPVRSQYTLVLVNQPLEAECDLSKLARIMVYSHFYTNPTLWFSSASESHSSAGVRNMTYSHFYS